jgi:Tol biopolymer transport system component
VTRAWPLVVAGLVVALAALWVYGLDRRIGSSQVLTPVPFTSLAGREVAPTFSRDGSQIAFAWSPEGLQDQFDLYVKVIGSENHLRLTTHPADFIFPAWSPDGGQIAFARWAGDDRGIYLVSPLGGSEKKLADRPYDGILPTRLSWSPDGKRLAFLDDGPSGKAGISLLDVVTLEKRWWGSPSEDCAWSWVPAFSPDGTSLAVSCVMSFGINDLFVAPASGGPGRRVAHVQGDFSGMTWAADSGSLIYGANGDLWRVFVAGGEPEKLLAGRDAAMPTISHDGHRLAYTTQSVYNVNLWQVVLAAPTRAAGPPVKIIASSRTQSRPAFSPDGTRLAFDSTRSGTGEVWTSDADGSNAVALTAFGGPWTGTARWSPDGRFIAFDSRADRGSNIYVVDAAGGRPRRVDTGVDDSSEPAWSSDGKSLYFTGTVGGAPQIYKVPIEDGESTQLTTQGGSTPRAPAADGRIYYSTLREIWSVSPTGGDEQRFSGIPPRPTEVNDAWGLSTKGVYFITPDPSRPRIDFFEFSSARIVRLVDLPGRPAPWAGALALSPDGGRLIYPQLDGIASDIMLVNNFR